MSAEINVPKYPILDDIEVPDKVIENWQITIDMLADIAEVPAALIMRVHARDIEVFVASHSPGNVYHPGEKAPLDIGLYCETVMSTQRKLLVPNALKSSDWDHNPDIKLGMISYCGLPLTWPNGEIFGTICILDAKENAYNQRAHHLIERFCDSIQLSLNSIYTASIVRSQKEKAERALRNSEACSQRYLDTIQTMMVVLDTKGSITTFNRAAQALMGFTEAELLGHNWFATCLPQPEGLNSVYPMFQRIMAGDPAPFAEYENDVVCRDGSRRLISWRISYIKDDEGRIVGTLSSGEDITERKWMGEELKKQKQILIQQSKMAAMGEMLELIAHQWRQPLSAIGMAVQDIKEAYTCGELNENYIKDHVGTTMNQINFMSKTIDDFKNFFKPSKKKLRFDVKSAIEELLSMFARMFKKNDVDISIRTEQDTVMFTDGYANEFKQVVLNILNNAKDAIVSIREAGSEIQGLVQVNIFNNVERDKIIVSIKDNGGGIPENIIGKIFEPYYTTKGGKGTGLGLYMSKTIIETNMGGSLEVNSVDGLAEFIIELGVSRSEGI